MKIKNAPSTYNVFYGELTNLFCGKNEGILHLEPCIVKGSVQIFNLAEGLQVRFWDTNISKEIEVFGAPPRGFENTFYTLVFFLNKSNIQIGSKNLLPDGSMVWDTILISAKSHYKLSISPQIRGQFVSITISKRWLLDNVLMEGNDGTTNLKEKIGLTDTFPLLECKTASETRDVHNLFDASSKTSLGSFYIKSLVLKIISDFFNKLKQRKTSSFPNMCHGAFIDAAERYLGKNLSGPLPDLKELAKKLCVSESTLKRHFKKKHGVNMSSYFNCQKMEYARQLVQEKNVAAN